MKMATPELTARGMMSLARLQVAPLSPTNSKDHALPNRFLDDMHGENKDDDHDDTLVEEETKENEMEQQQAHDSLSPPRYDYLGLTLNQSDIDMVQEFERRWAQFVQSKGETEGLDGKSLLPKGRRERRIEQLQADIRVLQEKKDSVEGELWKQLSFIRNSTESLQYVYNAKKQSAAQEQQELHDELTQRVQDVSTSHALRDETFPWFHFMRQLDQQTRNKNRRQGSKKNGTNAEDDDEDDKNSILSHSTFNSILQTTVNSSDEPSDKTIPHSPARHHPTAMRPSDRALYLAEHGTWNGNETKEKKENDQEKRTTTTSGDEMELRAYRVDHALLSAHVNMLHKEIERCEKSMRAQEFAGHFLTQHSVWRILAPNKQPVRESAESFHNNNNNNHAKVNDEDEKRSEELSQDDDTDYAVGGTSPPPQQYDASLSYFAMQPGFLAVPTARTPIPEEESRAESSSTTTTRTSSRRRQALEP